MGSEPGMGWNWIVSLAQYCDCYVISEGEFRPQVEQWLEFPENQQFSQSLHFYWLPIGGDDAERCARIRRMCWNQGDWRFYYHYRKWQKRVAECARRIVDAQCKSGEPIQILHQLNMIGFREPGFLWQVSKDTGVPLIWGPIDAKEGFPMAYAKGASLKIKAFLLLKNAITRLQLRFMPRVRHAAEQSSLLLSASSDSQRSISCYWHKQSALLNETGCSVQEVPEENLHKSGSAGNNTFDILWCGKMDFRKQLDLAIRAVAKSKVPNAILHVIGDGDNAPYKQLAEQVQANVIWYGRQPHAKVQQLMRNSDVLLFTSVAEGTPHVVLEAIANHLPVICHQTCGQGDVVDDEIGMTIPLTTPEQSMCAYAKAISYLNAHPRELAIRKNNCAMRSRELTWNKKAQELLTLYQSVLLKSLSEPIWKK